MDLLILSWNFLSKTWLIILYKKSDFFESSAKKRQSKTWLIIRCYFSFPPSTIVFSLRHCHWTHIFWRRFTKIQHLTFKRPRTVFFVASFGRIAFFAVVFRVYKFSKLTLICRQILSGIFWKACLKNIFFDIDFHKLTKVFKCVHSL